MVEAQSAILAAQVPSGHLVGVVEGHCDLVAHKVSSSTQVPSVHMRSPKAQVDWTHNLTSVVHDPSGHLTIPTEQVSMEGQR